MDEKHLDVLRSLDGPAGGHGGRGRVTRFREYGNDDFPVETVLVFRCGGRETRAAVKHTDTRWKITGHRRLRSWDALVRIAGPGCEVSQMD